MEDVKKKKFVKPELIKFDKPLDEVTLCNHGSGGYTGDNNWYSWWKK